MPNLKKFIDSNRTYRKYMQAADKGIYYAPYLDGDKEFENSF